MYVHHKIRVHIQVTVYTGSQILNISYSSPEHILKEKIHIDKYIQGEKNYLMQQSHNVSWTKLTYF